MTGEFPLLTFSDPDKAWRQVCARSDANRRFGDAGIAARQILPDATHHVSVVVQDMLQDFVANRLGKVVVIRR